MPGFDSVPEGVEKPLPAVGKGRYMEVKYPDPHAGAILTPKSPTINANQEMYGSNKEIAQTFHELACDGNFVFDLLQFAREFFLKQGELFTTYEEIWLDPNDLNEFEALYLSKLHAPDPDPITNLAEFKKIGEFIKIAKKNQQPIIFVT